MFVDKPYPNSQQPRDKHTGHLDEEHFMIRSKLQKIKSTTKASTQHPYYKDNNRQYRIHGF